MKYGFLKYRKGITPVLSIVLLVMLMVGLIMGVYMFLNGSMSQSQEQAEKTTSKVTEGTGSNLVIDSVWSGNGGVINFTIRNIGTTSFSQNEIGNTSVYINNVPAHINVAGSNIVGLAPQESTYIALTESYNAGDVLKVVPVKGAPITKTLPAV